MEENKYLLAMMLAKRIKQLNNKANPLVKTNSNDSIVIALEEIKEGKVFVKKESELENLKTEEIFNESAIDE
jgi:DNA-directed RNA polymerase omega subunit